MTIDYADNPRVSAIRSKIRQAMPILKNLPTKTRLETSLKFVNKYKQDILLLPTSEQNQIRAFINDMEQDLRKISAPKNTLKKVIGDIAGGVVQVSGAGALYKGVTGKDVIKPQSKIGQKVFSKTSTARDIAAKTGLVVGGGMAAGAIAKKGLGTKITSKIKDLKLPEMNLPKLSDQTKELINKGLESVNPLKQAAAEKVLKEAVAEEIKNPTQEKEIKVLESSLPLGLTQENLLYIVGGIVAFLFIMTVLKKK